MKQLDLEVTSLREVNSILQNEKSNKFENAIWSRSFLTLTINSESLDLSMFNFYYLPLITLN